MRLLGVAVVAGTLAIAPVGANAGSSSCAAERSFTLAENGKARIYLDRGDNTIACSKTNARRQTIAEDGYDHVSELNLRGHHVAYYKESCEVFDPAECSRGLYVFDVRRPDDEGFSAGGYINTVALRSNGSVAWSEDGLDPRYEDEREEIGVIYRHTRRGTTRLDRGHEVDPDSLRLNGRKLSWRHGSRVRRATLR